MASTNPAERKRIASTGAYTMWSGVTDRAERLRNAHDNSPSGFNWHARRLFGQDVDPDGLTKAQWKQVADARLAWLRANAIKAARGRQRQRARRLRESADAIEAELQAG